MTHPGDGDLEDATINEIEKMGVRGGRSAHAHFFGLSPPLAG